MTTKPWSEFKGSGVGGTGSATTKSKTFETPYHSAFSWNRSQQYHAQHVTKMNPTKSRQNAVRYPQTGLGG